MVTSLSLNDEIHNKLEKRWSRSLPSPPMIVIESAWNSFAVFRAISRSVSSLSSSKANTLAPSLLARSFVELFIESKSPIICVGTRNNLYKNSVPPSTPKIKS